MAKNKIDGNNKNNKLNGTSSGDRIDAKGGKDVLKGKAGNDVLFGGDGNDKLFGDKGKDELFGGKGNDTLDGGVGTDELFGGKGNDVIIVSAGADVLSGGAGRDTLDASGWTDGVWLNLAEFTRTDFSEPFPFVEVDAGTMKLRDDGPSEDWVVQAVTDDFEVIIGSESKDWINLDHRNSFVDRVDLGKGNDVFSGFSADVVIGGKGADRISINQGTANGGKGDDVLTTIADTENNSSRSIKTYLNGGGGDDLLIISDNTKAKGGAGDDILRFLDSDSDNRVFGGSGADIFEFNSLGGSGIMRDFKPGVDKIDLRGYSGTDPSITWAAIQDWFEAGETGVRIRLDSDRFSNQLFEFKGLSKEDLSESDFLL